MSLISPYRYVRRHSVVLCVVLCLFLGLISTQAQDNTPAASTNVLTETPTDIPLSTVEPTLATDVPPTELTPTEVIPTEVTPTDVTPTEPAPTESSVTPETPTAETPTAETLTPETPTEAPVVTEIALPLVYSTNFDTGIVPELSGAQTWLEILLGDGKALQSSAEAATVVYTPSRFHQAAIQARVFVNVGTANLSLYNYRASLSAEGVVSLIQGTETVLGSNNVTLSPEGTVVRLDVIGAQVRVLVNGAVVIDVVSNDHGADSTQAGFSASAGALVRVDDLAIYGDAFPAESVPTQVTPEEVIPENEEPLAAPLTLLVEPELEATTNGNSIELTWIDAADETSYEIRRTVPGQAAKVFIVAAGTTTFTDTLTCGIVASYKVIIHLPTGSTSSYPLVVGRTSPCNPIPSCPSLSAAQRLTEGTMGQYQYTGSNAGMLTRYSATDGVYFISTSPLTEADQETSVQGASLVERVYRRNPATCTTTMVDVTGTGDVTGVMIVDYSADGTKFLYTLAINGPYGSGPAYLRNMTQSAPVQLPLPADSQVVSLSADGRYVIFNTKEALVPEVLDEDGFEGVYLYDTFTNSFIAGSVSNGTVFEAYRGVMTTVAGKDYLLMWDGFRLYLRSMQDDVTTIVSIDKSGAPVPGQPSFFATRIPMLATSNGELHVLFGSETGSENHYYVRSVNLSDITTGTTASIPMRGENYLPVMSADGRWFAFSSFEAYTSQDTNNKGEIYIYDRLSRSFHQFLVNGYPLADAVPSAMSANGSTIVFVSADGSVVINDINNVCELDFADNDYNENCRDVFAAPNPFYGTPAPVPPVQCTTLSVVVTPKEFTTNGDMSFTVQNTGTDAAYFTGMSIQWGGAKTKVPALKLRHMSVGGTSADDIPNGVSNGTGIVAWLSPLIFNGGGDTSSPSVGYVGQPSTGWGSPWQTTLLLQPGTTTTVYLAFEGVGADTLTTHGINWQDFSGTVLDFGCDPDRSGNSASVLVMPTSEPTTPAPTTPAPTTPAPTTPAPNCSTQPSTTAQLIAAIVTGNSAGAPYSICLTANTTYSVSARYGYFFGYIGLPSITGEIIIEGNGATIERAANAPTFRLFGVNTNAKFTLKNATLKNGLTDLNAGAALVNVQGNVTFDSVIMQGNKATHPTDGSGGAIYNYQGTFKATNSAFLENEAAVIASSVYAWDGTTTISGSCIASHLPGALYQIAKTGSGVFTATGNWWSGGVSAGPGVNAGSSLTTRPSICAAPATPTPTTPAPTTPAPTTPAPTLPANCDVVAATVPQLIAAIQTGNTNGGTLYQICLTPYTEYTLTASNTVLYGPVGLPVITGKVLIDGTGATIQRSASASLFRLFAVNTNGQLTLKNLILQSGKVDANAGGAILNVQGTVTLDSVKIKNNAATHTSDAKGGAIYNYQGTLNVTNSVFQSNQAAVDAGAIHSWDGSTTISGSCILDNVAPTGFEILKTGSGTVNASGNWWGSDGVGTSVNAGVNTANALTSAPVICGGTPTPTPTTPSPEPTTPSPEPTTPSPEPTTETPTPSPTPASNPALLTWPEPDTIFYANGTGISPFYYWTHPSATFSRDFTVQVDDDPDFGSVNGTCVKTIAAGITQGSCVNAGFFLYGTYYWRVLIDGSNPSQVFKFTGSPYQPNALTPVTPASGETLTTSTVSLTWDVGTQPSLPGAGPFTYDVQVSQTSDFATLTASATGLTSTSFVTPALTNGTYYWRARAKNVYGGLGQWPTTPSSFTVNAAPPTPTPTPTTTEVTGFTLINGSTNTDIRPLVDDDVIDLRTVGTSTLRIRANTSPQTINRVVFGLNNQPSYSTDTAYEYRLAATWSAVPGQYTLKATPYTGTSSTLVAGTAQTIDFTVRGYIVSVPTVSNGKSYTRSALKVGSLIYKDRTYAVTYVDSVLANADYIQAVNNDKEATGDSFMTVTLTCDATLYIAYDKRLTPPAWMSDWTITTRALLATDGSGDPLSRYIYSKHYSAGTVTLGANYGTAQSNTYTLIAKPDAGCN